MASPSVMLSFLLFDVISRPAAVATVAHLFGPGMLASRPASINMEHLILGGFYHN